MTSPPLSEGPSPEARKKAHAITQIDCQHLTQWMCCPVCVALALDEAKRSAHLEDARAGCMDCRGGSGGYYVLEPTRDKAGWWYHVPSPRCIHEYPSAKTYRGMACARPEVWDALSLLPPKGTK